MASQITDLTVDDFDRKTIDQDGILLFYKSICPFCKTLEAVIEKFSKTHPRVPLFRVEFEEQPKLAERLGVERAPTLFILKQGNITARKAGLMNVKELNSLWEQA